METKKIDACAIGGANFDFQILPFDEGRSVSTPSSIKKTWGGVARNIAENLVKLNVSTALISAFSKDKDGKDLAHYCAMQGINLDKSKIRCPEDCSRFIKVNNSSGNAVEGYSDTNVITNITKNFIQEKMSYINESRICVLDANLPVPTIEYVAKKCKVPVFAATVSGAKSTKFLHSLEHIDFLNTDIAGAQHLTGKTIKNLYDMSLISDTLLDKGVKNIFISHPQGIFFKNRKETGFMRRLMKKRFKSMLGVGDAFSAGAIWTILKQIDNLHEMTKYGLAASSITLNSFSAVNPDINSNDLIRLVENEEFECIDTHGEFFV